MSHIVASHLLQRASAADGLRQQTYMRAWQAYNGQLDPAFKIDRNMPNDNVYLNYARLFVDKGVSFLFGLGVEFDMLDKDEEKEATDKSPEDVWLRDVWMHNNKAVTLQKLGQNGGVCGHAYIKIAPRRPFPRLIVLDPSIVTVNYRPDDMDIVDSYLVTYDTVNPKNKRAERIEELHERVPHYDEEGVEDTDQATWTITVTTYDVAMGEAVAKKNVEWPYNWCAIHDCQNLPAANEYYGTSDITEDMLDLGRSINYVMSNLMRIIRYHAHPRTVGKGFEADQLRQAANETIILPDAESDLFNLEMESDLGSSVEFFKRLKEAMHQMARVPEIAAGKLEDVGNISGLALAVMYQPLIEKTQVKRGLYGAMLEQLCGHLLELEFDKPRAVRCVWPEVLPRDPLQERQMYQIDAQFGVSMETIQTKLGYEFSIEQIRSKNEKEFRQELKGITPGEGTGAGINGADANRNMRGAEDKQQADNQRGMMSSKDAKRMMK